MNRKRVILAALLGILTLCLLYAFYATPQQQKAPPRQVVQGSGKGKVIKRPVSERGKDRVQLALLDVASEPFPGADRDIFRFKPLRYLAPPVVATMPVVAPEPEPVAPVLPVQPTPIETMQRALSKFIFLGFLEKAGEKTVFLSSGGEVFIVKPGEFFGADNEFEVAAINGNILKVRRTGQETMVEIPLIEKQQLSAMVSAPAQLQARPNEPQLSPSIPNTSTPNPFAPTRRKAWPPTPQNIDVNQNETNSEENPEQERNVDFPKLGDALKGEVDGSN